MEHGSDKQPSQSFRDHDGAVVGGAPSWLRCSGMDNRNGWYGLVLGLVGILRSSGGGASAS